jgi:hypothetical protein
MEGLSGETLRRKHSALHGESLKGKHSAIHSALFIFQNRKWKGEPQIGELKARLTPLLY